LDQPIIIHPETPEDIEAIRHVNDQAFGQQAEGILVDKLRARGIVTLSLVTMMENEIVGHILFSPVIVQSEDSSFDAITLAPMAIMPVHQRKGIGSKLVRSGLRRCRQLGHDIVFVLGHPEYYPRFGFVPARSKGVKCEFEFPDEAWMVLELLDSALAGRKGTVKFQPEFHDAM
jgi:putative acetyltransferase